MYEYPQYFLDVPNQVRSMNFIKSEFYQLKGTTDIPSCLTTCKGNNDFPVTYHLCYPMLVHFYNFFIVLNEYSVSSAVLFVPLQML